MNADIACRRFEFPFTEAVNEAKALVVSSGEYAPLSLDTAFTDWEDLVGFVSRFGIFSAPEITTELLARFLEAKDRSNGDPAVASKHRRRTSARQLFRLLRFLGHVASDSDPTVDLPLPPRTAGKCRPLSDGEIGNCESASRYDFAATRYPALFALAETGATVTELCQVRTDDVSIDDGAVWLRGSKRTDARPAPLTTWGVGQVRRHIQSERPGPGDHLVFGGMAGDSRFTTIWSALSTVLMRAGLERESDVKVESIRAWVGRSMYDRGERIEKVTRWLGMRSTDGALKLIGEDWRSVEDFVI